MTNQEHIQALIDNITTDLRKLRSLILEPVGIQFAGEVMVEMRPEAEGDEVSVYRLGMGNVAVRFDDDGVDVYVIDTDGELVGSVSADLFELGAQL